MTLLNDLQALKEKVDLLALAGRDTTLKRVASTNGGEFAGPCPFCGGRDRFRLQPKNAGGPRWLCRGCSEGRWQSAVDYVMRRDRVDFKQAVARLNGGDLLRTRERRETPVAPSYVAPAGDWQAQALRAIEDCRAQLRSTSGSRALNYLHGRGLNDETIERFRLGFSPVEGYGPLKIPRGVVIPCVAGGEVWYLKVRRSNSKPKYLNTAGSRAAAIFNADDLISARTALFCEGEFDAMIAWQELGDYGLAVCSFGSGATSRPDLATWGVYLLGLDLILVTYDADAAGQAGTKIIAELSERVRLAPLPPGAWKDINEFHLATGQLAAWILPFLQFYAAFDPFDWSGWEIDDQELLVEFPELKRSQAK